MFNVKQFKRQCTITIWQPPPPNHQLNRYPWPKFRSLTNLKSLWSPQQTHGLPFTCPVVKKSKRPATSPYYKNPWPWGHEFHKVVEIRIIKEYRHIHSMTNISLPLYQSPLSCGHKFYNFGRGHLAYPDNPLKLTARCLVAENKIINELRHTCFYCKTNRNKSLHQRPWALGHRFHRFGRGLLAYPDNLLSLTASCLVAEKRMFKELLQINAYNSPYYLAPPQYKKTRPWVHKLYSFSRDLLDYTGNPLWLLYALL